MDRIKKLNYKKLVLYILPFCATVAVMFFLYWKKRYCPFGDDSLACMDANIQYLDFFAYLKDVLSGENNISYSFGKTLGGTGIAVFSYYLASPFNLLLFFFEKSQLMSFFDCLVALKLGVAASTAAYFLDKRFEGKLNKYFVFLLSISYALMQYSIAQGSNVMWLDGVYMLPLMLLGVYKVVKDKNPYLLIFTTGLSMLFNWYSGAINCLFTGIWFCLESLLAVTGQSNNFKEYILINRNKIATYIVSMFCGVILSACLFLPTLYSLSSGGRGGIQWRLLKGSFSGNVINVIQNFTLGATSSNGSVSLYCGSLAILGCISFFLAKGNTAIKKRIGMIFAFSILIFYWQPLFWIFSLLNDASSYWYRYSYGTIFLIIFIAAYYYTAVAKEKMETSFLRNAVLYSLVLLTFSYVKPVWDIKHVYYSCLFIMVIAVLLYIFQMRCKFITGLLLGIVLIIELSYNASLLMNVYHWKDASGYKNYSISQQEQIRKLKGFDDGIYRISQILNYRQKSSITANYNESLAYNYWSIAGYTSDPDNNERKLLDKLGYRMNGDNLCVVNTSILAADSLLGVKYVLSPREINGLEIVNSLGTYNKKNVYRNPYVLPMAFVYNANKYTAKPETTFNPFEYQNWLYSQLSGEKIVLYSAVDFTESKEGKDSRNYILKLPTGIYAVYGNIPWESYMDATLDINGYYKNFMYSRWLSPAVFYIPTTAGDKTAYVKQSYKKDNILDKQFYALNLDTLKTVTDKIKNRKAESITIQNGYAMFEVTGNVGENLYTSIPYNKGWTVTLNGKEVNPELFAGCMISIPLEDGKNIIKMQYTVPYLKFGIGISIGMLILLGLDFIRRKRQCYYH